MTKGRAVTFIRIPQTGWTERNSKSLHCASIRFHFAGTGEMTNSFTPMTSRERSIKSQPLRITILWEFDDKHP
jgi:hypothetical protein